MTDLQTPIEFPAPGPETPPGHTEWLAKRERRRQERQDQQRRRAYGLVQRHTRKLRRAQ